MDKIRNVIDDQKRRAIKAGRLPVYERILDTLRDMANPHGLCVVHVQTLAFATKDRYPECERPKLCELYAAVAYLAHAGAFEQIHPLPGHPEGVLRLRFPRKGLRDE
jgi:hypothetical protein